MDLKEESFGASKDTIYVEGNHIYFYTWVTQDSAGVLNRALRQTAKNIILGTDLLGEATPKHPIHLHIHSFGGSLFAGFAVRDTILQLPVPVHTHIEGGAASSATIISGSGAHRTIGVTSMALIHQLSDWNCGSYEQLKDGQKNSKKQMELLRKFYIKHLTLPPKKLKALLRRDLWLNAKECLKYGLVDEILG